MKEYYRPAQFQAGNVSSSITNQALEAASTTAENFASTFALQNSVNLKLRLKNVYTQSMEHLKKSLLTLFKKQPITSPTNSDTDSELQEDEYPVDTLKDYWMRDEKVNVP